MVGESPTTDGLNHAQRHADEKGERERDDPESDGHRQRFAQRVGHGAVQGIALPEIPAQQRGRPPCILHGDRLVEAQLAANSRHVGTRRRRRNEKRRGIARSETNQREGDREDQPQQHERAAESTQHAGGGSRRVRAFHVLKLHRRAAKSTRLVGAALLVACGTPPRPRDVAVYASGTDLESGNPLVTVHPLSRQVQRHVLFVTLARYDSVLAPVPYAARSWDWAPDRRRLTFHLVSGLRWHDGKPTTARDVAFTLLAARDPATGYPRAADL